MVDWREGRTLRFVWDELDAECVRSIERGSVDDSFRLSRRHRWKTLAVDVDGDVAIVLVATRGKRVGGEISCREYRRRAGGWDLFGSGGGGGGNRTLPSRPAPADRWFQTVSSGMSRDMSARWPMRRRIRHLEFQAADGVSHVEWRERRRAVAPHGFVCVVWRGRSMPRVDLMDLLGRRVDVIRRRDGLSPELGIPWRARIRYALFRRFHHDEWFNYSP